jgi:hypothetical protein
MFWYYLPRALAKLRSYLASAYSVSLVILGGRALTQASQLVKCLSETRIENLTRLRILLLSTWEELSYSSHDFSVQIRKQCFECDQYLGRQRYCAFVLLFFPGCANLRGRIARSY